MSLHRDDVTPIPKAGKRERAPRRPLPRISAKRRRSLRDLDKAQRIALARSGGYCEAQGFPHACTRLATEFHHVRPRSRGGRHTPENLLHLCANAHRAAHLYRTLAKAHGVLT